MATSEHTIYARASFVETISVVRALPTFLNEIVSRNGVSFLYADPVTSVVPTQDESTYLVMTLDGHIRLINAITGKLLNDFSGHVYSPYRYPACLGHGEASVVAGDENGAIWAWALLDVSSLILMHTGDIYLSSSCHRQNLLIQNLLRRYTIKSSHGRNITSQGLEN